jgi:hypothetical protein
MIFLETLKKILDRVYYKISISIITLIINRFLKGTKNN